MKYQWILFDADETLYSFNSYFGLKAMLKHYSIDFTEQDYEAFQAVNKPLWVKYQNKEITAEELRAIRFSKLAEQTGQSAEELNHQLMHEMSYVSQPLNGVMDMLKALHGKVKMAIVTNGFNALQEKRLNNTKTKAFFDLVITSENVGIAKPDARIFEATFAQMGNVDKSKILMVGDTLASDILGGNSVGIDTCWYNPTQYHNDSDIRPTYEIHSILDLVSIAEKGTF
ncbi:noncanonical pyrimidine nucleotidase, YjjG family [Pasteurellaceae bacterium 15-036681]|nr:noncanonical pyrimidine nucleotidase, YjjG family [Pasteurellaceae bacterium 15-036681]